MTAPASPIFALDRSAGACPPPEKCVGCAWKMDSRFRGNDDQNGSAFSTVARGLVPRPLALCLSEGEDLDSGFRRNDGPRAVARGLVPRSGW